MSRYRNWCFTIFEINDEPITEQTILDIPAASCRYAVWQLELCPESGRRHFQGYIEFERPKRLGGVQTVLGSRTAHCEKRRGTRKQAIAYCRKEDSRIGGPWDVGVPDIQPGRRTDLAELGAEISNGLTLSQVRQNDPTNYIKYRRGIEALVCAANKERAKEFRNLEVLVYYGDAGSGKTRAAFAHSDSYYCLDQGERVWFDGYESETTLIIDDFYGWIKYGMLLRILDGHMLRCEIKGGFTYALWTTVIITSNKHPRQWYGQGLTPALERRLTSIRSFEL